MLTRSTFAGGLDRGPGPRSQVGRVQRVAAERQHLAAVNAGKQKPVGVAVGHRGVVELLPQLLDGDVADDRDEAVGDAGVGVLGQRSQHRPAIPGVANDAR